jgi:hypothetical protein
MFHFLKYHLWHKAFKCKNDNLRIERYAGMCVTGYYCARCGVRWYINKFSDKRTF